CGFGERARAAYLLPQRLVLRAVRQPPVPEQIGDFLETGSPEQLVDVVAAKREPPALAVNLCNLGRRRDDPFQSSGYLRRRAARILTRHLTPLPLPIPAQSYLRRAVPLPKTSPWRDIARPDRERSP